MHAADTNVLLRLLTPDDPAQTTAAEAFVTSGVWISHLVLLEAVWVLGSIYDATDAQIAAAVRKILNRDEVLLEDAEVVTAALTLFLKPSHPEFADCLILESARKAGHLPLGTFDRDLAKLPGAKKIA